MYTYNIYEYVYTHPQKYKFFTILLEYTLSYINVLLVTFNMTPTRVYVLTHA